MEVTFHHAQSSLELFREKGDLYDGNRLQL